MTRLEALKGAIRIAKEENEEGLEWSDAARQRWIGYVGALSQVGVLTTKEFFDVLREDLDADDDEQEYAMYVQDVNLPGAEDLVDLRRSEVPA